MLQKFGTALSREQMKMVMGGNPTGVENPGGDGTICACDARYNCVCGSTSNCVAHASRTDCIVCNGVDECAVAP